MELNLIKKKKIIMIAIRIYKKEKDYNDSYQDMQLSLESSDDIKE